MLFYLKLN